jgi:hypothetical protein
MNPHGFASVFCLRIYILNLKIYCSHNKYMKLDDIINASVAYADTLNARPLTPFIHKIIEISGTREKFHVIPYCYFQEEFIDIENGKKLLRAYYTEEKESVDIEDKDHILTYLVPLYKKLIPEGENYCGIIGVPIYNSEGEVHGDHYVSFFIRKNILYYFDSAVGGTCKKSYNYNTFILLRNSFSIKRSYCNKKVFEIAGGADDNPYSYISQNIFCHSWSFWFLHWMFTGKKISQIDKLGGNSKYNLILIKQYIYHVLIPHFDLSHLLKMRRFDAFKYIILKTEDIQQII